jgi:septal ring factor EnvC (AmiA/AmiB activator)
MQPNFLKSVNIDNLYHEIETYVLNNQMQCFLIFAWFVTFLNSVIFNSNQTSKIHQLKHTIVELTDQNSELESENETLGSKVKSLTHQLEHFQIDNLALKATIHKLNDRNQTLCESLSDFIKYKKRKIDTDEVEEESTHNYNLRNRKNVNYSGQDSNNHDPDSDYEQSVKK